MSRQHTVTQIDAKAKPLLPGSSRGLLVRRGEEGRHDEPARKEWAVARSGKRTPVSESTAPVCARRPSCSRTSKNGPA
jgi:hypothetical protein